MKTMMKKTWIKDFEWCKNSTDSTKKKNLHLIIIWEIMCTMILNESTQRLFICDRVYLEKFSSKLCLISSTRYCYLKNRKKSKLTLKVFQSPPQSTSFTYILNQQYCAFKNKGTINVC